MTVKNQQARAPKPDHYLPRWHAHFLVHPRVGLINISDKHLRRKPRSVRAVFRFSKCTCRYTNSDYRVHVIVAHRENNANLSRNRVVLSPSVIQCCPTSKTMPVGLKNIRRRIYRSLVLCIPGKIIILLDSWVSAAYHRDFYCDKADKGKSFTAKPYANYSYASIFIGNRLNDTL